MDHLDTLPEYEEQICRRLDELDAQKYKLLQGLDYIVRAFMAELKMEMDNNG